MRILCGTDLLPKTRSALDRAGMLALQLGAELTLLHVAPLTESEQLLEEDIQRARVQLASRASPPLWRHGRSPHVCVRSGGAARVLIETATKLDAGLVILGRHPRRLARDALAGTLAERLLSELSCPVLIVHRMPWAAYRNILLALDCSKASANTVRVAEALVLRASTRAAVVHAYQLAYSSRMVYAGIARQASGAYSDRLKQRAHRQLRDLLEEVSRDPSRYELLLENTTSTVAVQNVVRRLNPDLLVVGTRGRGRWRRALLGSVASRLLASASSDVLVVPAIAPRITRQNK